MPESLVDSEPRAVDPFRIGTVLSCLVIGLSYLLPWATVDGTVQRLNSTGAVVNATVQGSIPPREIALFPDLSLGAAIVAAVISLLRWKFFWQFLIGILGVVAGFAVLITVAVVDASGQREAVTVGSYTAFPSAFDPATGLWIALLGSLGLIVCGFAAAVRRYVRIKGREK